MDWKTNIEKITEGLSKIFNEEILSLEEAWLKAGDDKFKISVAIELVPENGADMSATIKMGFIKERVSNSCKVVIGTKQESLNFKRDDSDAESGS
jgi:hypothetical protein